MKYWTRKHGSQRTTAPVDITFEPNWGGQNGALHMVFFDGERWHFIKPENIHDVRLLQSQASILAHNLKEPPK